MATPDYFSENASTPEEATTRPERMRKRLVSRASSTAARLQTAFTGGHAPQRISPRMRFAQVGSALVAVGVLGTLIGHSGTEIEPDQGKVKLATQSAQQQQIQAPQPQLQAAQQVQEVQAQQKPAPTVDPVDSWINQASKVLERNGYPKHTIDREAIRTIVLNESGGNPSATNNWDSNAAAGTPSQGLMQTINPTFESYALPGHQDILDPVDNIIAGTRYSIDRYGSVSDVPGITGLRSGGSYQGY